MISRFKAPFFHGWHLGEKISLRIATRSVIFVPTIHFSILLMDNNLLFIFKSEDMKRLLEAGSDYIVIRSFLEAVELKDGRKAGALRVYADAVNKNKADAIESIEGCPKPPCETSDGTGQNG